jgi:hypothetical protein
MARPSTGLNRSATNSTTDVDNQTAATVIARHVPGRRVCSFPVVPTPRGIHS